MKETLGQKQRRFSKAAAQLILQAYAMGYEVSFGDAYRDPRVHGEMGIQKGYGHKSSCHKLRLAIDLNLFLDGKYLDKSEDHKRLGEWWEAQGGCWGGRFANPDGNHYSFEHEGHK